LERDGSDLHEEIKLKAFPYKNYGPQLSITDRNYQLRIANALWFILEKMTKIADRNYGNCGPQKLGWKREFTALKRFSQENIDF
jgi:hypothetical protein